MLKKVLLGLALFSMEIAVAQVSTSRRYPEAKAYLENLAKQYPQNASLFSLGHSNQGVEIVGLKVGNGPVRNMVVATHHGNEYGSTEIALGFADSIAKAPVAGQTIFVIPVLNIEGYNSRSRNERVNGVSIDLNRDYPGPCGSEGPFNSRSSKALADFIESQNIVASATLHTAWPAVVYPWGISTHDTDTHYTNDFVRMAENATTWSKYAVGNATDVVYPADGTYEDFSFWKHGVWTLLFEIGRYMSPNHQDLERMVQENVPGLRKMFENAPTVRAADHEFKGRCDTQLRILDLHIE